MGRDLESDRQHREAGARAASATSEARDGATPPLPAGASEAPAEALAALDPALARRLLARLQASAGNAAVARLLGRG